MENVLILAIIFLIKNINYVCTIDTVAKFRKQQFIRFDKKKRNLKFML